MGLWVGWFAMKSTLQGALFTISRNWLIQETDARQAETNDIHDPNTIPATSDPRFGLCLLGQFSSSGSQTAHPALPLGFTAPMGLLVSPILGPLTIRPGLLQASRSHVTGSTGPHLPLSLTLITVGQS